MFARLTGLPAKIESEIMGGDLNLPERIRIYQESSRGESRRTIVPLKKRCEVELSNAAVGAHFFHKILSGSGTL